ncbi:MAG: hypothetical protein U9R50_09090 [Campylobacterota bacterium]|nr:hypothetical protein [Campylobacterota bacterium]
MRNRNGNCSLLLTLSSLIFFTTLLSAQTYRIGYRVVVKDAILVDETLNISRTMTPCHGKARKALILENTKSNNIHTLLQEHREEFYNYLYRQSLHVRHNNKTTNAIATSLTTLTFPTECFTVDFKGNLAKITLIK